MRLTKPRSALIALGSILVLVMAGLPLALGAGAQRAYQELLRSTHAALPANWVIVERYDRGWFSSHATADLTRQPTAGPAPAAGPTHLRLDSHIDQGPWSWFSAGPFPVAARIQTRVDWVDGPLPLPPLLIDTTIGANGAGRAQLLIPAADQPPDPPRMPDGYQLRSREITGSIHFRLSQPQATISLTIPSVALSTPSGPAASLGQARLSAEVTDVIGGVFTGRAHLAIAAARFTPPTGAVADDTQLERLTLTLDQTAAGPPPTRRLNLRLNAAAESVRRGGIAYRSALVGLSAESLDAQALADLAAGLRTLSSDAATPAMRGVLGATLLAQLLPRFMATGPRIEINPLRLITPEGPVTAHLSLAVVGENSRANRTAAALGALLGGGPAIWLGALAGEGELALPRPIALIWLARADPTGGSSPADQLQAWIDGGWVSAADDRITSSLRLASARLTINGKRVKLRWAGLGG